MYLFSNKLHRRLIIIGILVQFLILNAVMPYGTFDPRKHGFWIALFSSILVNLSLALTKQKSLEYNDGDRSLIKNKPRK